MGKEKKQQEETKEKVEEVKANAKKEKKDARTEPEAKKKSCVPVCISGVCGLVIGAAVVCTLWKTGVVDINNKVLAKTNFGSYTEKMLYNDLKEQQSLDKALEGIDKILVNEKYKLTEKQEKELNEQVENVLKYYTGYGYTEDQFLESNGFSSKEEFTELLTLDYKKNLIFIDYLKEVVPQEDIKNYYDKNVYGAITTKHMLVQIAGSVNEKDAKKKAEEIIKKLNDGKAWDDVVKEYGDAIIAEEVKDNGVNTGIMESYVEASKKLKVGEYTKSPVKTDYGYHVVYKVDEQPKPSIEEATNDIIETLGADYEAKDQNIRYKAIIKFRKDNGVEFKDKDMEKEYEEYCKKYEGQ